MADNYGTTHYHRNKHPMKVTAKTPTSLRPLLTIKADDSGSMPAKLEVLQTGMWDAPYHGSFMITPADLQGYIEHFNADVRPSSSTEGLPIDLDHDAGEAAGWITALSALPNDNGGWSLWADVSWTPMGEEKLTGGQYKFFSPEFCPEGYIDPEGDDDSCDNVLIGGGLTNRPLFKELQPIMASDSTDKSTDQKSEFKQMFISANSKGDSNMPTLDEVRIKEAADLTDEERQLLSDNLSELSADEKAKFELVADDSNTDTNTDDNTEEGEKADEGEVEGESDQDNKEGETVSANDKNGTQVTISASELDSLKAAAAQGVAANERLIRKEAEDHITNKVYSASEGFKAPADLKDELVGLYVSASAEQKTALDKLFDGIAPIKKADEMGAKGSGEGEFQAGDAAAQLTKLADERASEKSLSFSDALAQVRAENVELVAASDEAYEAGKPKLATK